MTRLLAIGNDEAGSTSDRLVDDVLAELAGWSDVTLEKTSKPEELDRVLVDHLDTDVVAVLGGDGSLHAVVEALFQAERLASTVVALIPMGTGNDFARTLGLSDEPLAAARSLRDAEERDVDLILNIHGHVVVNSAHVGVGAEAAATAAPLKKWLGPVGYALGALTSGLARPGADVEVTIDGRRLDSRGPVVQVAVGNGRYVGGGAPLLPTADPFDGLIDVAVSYSSDLPRRLAYGWAVRRGQHQHLDDVVYQRGREITVLGEPTRCTSDGELSEPSARHAWQILPGALRMLVPRAVSE